MSVIQFPIKKSQYQSLLLLGLVAFFIAHFTLLSPSSLEEDFSEVRSISPQELLSFFQNEPHTLATGLPTAVAPTYAIRELEYLSTDDKQKHWKMNARKSFMYQDQQLLHGRDIVFTWNDGQVSAKEAVSFSEKDEVELFGEVLLTMNNGVTLASSYVKIITEPTSQIIVPITESVIGTHKISKNSSVKFKSNGLYYSSTEEALKLLSQVNVEIITDKKTTVQSDVAVYFKKTDHLIFDMADNQTLEKQFVHTQQESMDLYSRKLKVDFEKQKVQTLTASGDTRFQDLSNRDHPVSGTAGITIYKESNNMLYLNDFPQIYQDKDTITGDSIIYDRTRDTIEVEQSNAFNKR